MAPSVWRPASSGAATTPSRARPSSWREQLFDGGGGRGVVRDGPGAPKAVDAAQPEVAWAPSSSLATAARIPGMTAPTESPVASAAAISAIAVSARGIGLGGPMPVWNGRRSLGHDVWSAGGRRDKMTDFDQ